MNLRVIDKTSIYTEEIENFETHLFIINDFQFSVEKSQYLYLETYDSEISAQITSLLQSIENGIIELYEQQDNILLSYNFSSNSIIGVSQIENGKFLIQIVNTTATQEGEGEKMLSIKIYSQEDENIFDFSTNENNNEKRIRFESTLSLDQLIATCNMGVDTLSILKTAPKIVAQHPNGYTTFENNGAILLKYNNSAFDSVNYRVNSQTLGEEVRFSISNQ